jgi:2-hydroxy-3-keto-5-methylthiopentenyl-1-phosphate phosphatase
MTLSNRPDYKALENNIIDVIKEEQIKLGYKSETIRLYYPMESVNHLLKTELSAEGLLRELKSFRDYVKERLGDIEYSNKETRFCIVIPPKGVTYVHEEAEDRHFLKEFIEKISEHGCTFLMLRR